MFVKCLSLLVVWKPVVTCVKTCRVSPLVPIKVSKLQPILMDTNSSSEDSDVELVSCPSGVGKDVNSSSRRKELNALTKEDLSLEQSSSTTILDDEKPSVLLILTGIPGSGKTSFAKKLEAKGWCRVCQDELLTRQQCENYAITQLLQGKPIVIDRCNVTKEQRAIWIKLAKNANAVVGCLVFTTPLHICVSRVAQRSEHPNLKGNDPKTESVIFQFAKDFCAPTAEEGIDFCRRIQTEQDEYRILQQLEKILNSQSS
ncbi:hypothetical protein GpartN1_g4767.t1 [Galdieria partita]|uniref:Uncharacterized protein n=1 Tax=Galdieria partita TaxID=83374 RepID=A0A9C7PZZ3_9RHOD|nr:hypothetical protein GpartN1_g4767.t1 [Galdieria partita]